MKNILLLLILLTAGSSFAQAEGSITFYSNTGDKFYVVLNGIRQNDRPETNVKINGLTNNWYSCKILSANNNFEIDKNIVVKYDTLVTYRIKEKRGKYKLRFYSQTPLGTSTAQPEQAVITYHATENTADDNTTTTDVNTTTNADVNSSTNTDVNTTTTTTTSTTSTTATAGDTNVSTNTSAGGNGESVNMNVSVSENGMDVNVSATGTDANGQTENVNTDVNMETDVNSGTTSTSTNASTNGTTTQEETTTTTSGTSNNGTTYYEETTTTTTTTTTTSSGNTDNTYYEDEDMTVTIESDNDNSCYTSDEEVDRLVKQIEEESFSDDQQRVANLAAKNKCMNTEQIKRVAESFTFSDNKLSFLKKAYDNCPDKDNYYELMEVLTYSTDKEELEKFINSK